MLPLWGSTESVGGGGKVRLAGHPGNAVCLKGIGFSVMLETFPQKLRKGYPDPLQVILMDLSGLKM